ncbi:DNA mismatch repair protein MutS [Owenweeksia hongkongensis DSM 17368]|uniref:DNA mismatch repair protein MutS n=2 Tax=Owenweeksia TaxID=267986 RepID=G8R1Z3_OWEHD|nr:DNA mismatch repair protein MutS [Owenweeksia hongkongensis DSM 17368]
MAGKSAETPLMRQYNQIKSKYPDALLLFRVGDFYETFGQDAVKASKILGIVLTKRSNGAAADMELAGFPHHSLDNYLPKLVRAGQRVAICDQLEDPKLTKNIVKRGVTELVTPGVTTSDQVLKSGSNNFLAAIYMEKERFGISFCDISTGEFLVAEGNHEYVDKLIQSLAPSEILFQKNKSAKYFELFGNRHYSFALDEWIFKSDFANESLNNHFKTKSLKGFGIEGMDLAIIAGGAIFHYLKETRHDQLGHITGVSRIEREEFVWMDRFTIRNLELFNSNSPDGVSLLDVIDHTQSPMGSRLLKRWLAMPLKKVAAIEDRQLTVEAFMKKHELAEDIAQLLQEIHDLERLVSKLSTGKIHPKELLQLKKGLEFSNAIKKKCAKVKQLSLIADQLHECLKLIELVSTSIKENPSVQISKGDVIADGVSAELDDLRDILNSGKDKLLAIQKREAEATGISNLKIAFNNVFGYYLEVRNTHKDKVPAEWVRKQTLVSAERYITEELKEYEQKILGAEDKILAIEQKLYNDVLEKALSYLPQIQQNAQVLARIDCLLSFALLAKSMNYVKPSMDDSYKLDIKGGRHPVIERQLAAGEDYISNDVLLDREEFQILMITGPNMSGKSALLRQTALISLMAQIGCYVPAKAASLGVVDKIFVRVGASDNISQGESTFMVEMSETASILNNLSDRSLVLLDEIGRGTSTYDGISIAWSIAEFLHEHPSRAKTLFATHYHELNEMEGAFERIRNFNVSVKEVNNSIIFMRKLKPGGSEHSFGIHVAKMAGMPGLVVNRAESVLKELEKSRSSGDKKNGKAKDEMQLSFFKLDDPILEELKEEITNLDINTLTPVEALMKLNGIKKKLGGV